MKSKLLLLLILLSPLAGSASHIVGGEFELIHMYDHQYRLNLILYFDLINGQPGAKDGYALARIYRSSDQHVMVDVFLNLVEESNVAYTQPECAIPQLATSKLLYMSILTLAPDPYNDPGGYYIVWERCCRNYTITNIFSQDPNGGGVYAGQTFYLEFPAVVKNGQPFIDSTPRLFPPLSDFASVNKPYYTDFGGIDDDGDSLSYSLVAPLNTKSGDALPPDGPRPRPYPPVLYRPPFSQNNVMAGAPDLKISKDGFLTVTPTVQGLFVFAVKVQEFRDGIKIGETRRDFQLLVIDGPRALPPHIEGKKLTDPQFVTGQLNAFFDSGVPNSDRCFIVRVTDPDAEIQYDGVEHVKIKAIALNFKKNLNFILPDESTAILVGDGSSTEFRICLPDCPLLYPGPAELAIIALDDACSLPLTDTLRVSVMVEPPPNQSPYFTSVNPVDETIDEGTQQAWPYAVQDDDGDTLVVSVLTDGFLLANAGMTFNNLSQVPGASNGEIKWDAYCDIYDFTHRTSFKVTVQVEDQDKCHIPKPTKAVYDLRVRLPGNADPIIDTDLTPAASEREVHVSRRIFESIHFKVTGTDLTDNDMLVMSGAGEGFILTDFGLSVAPIPVNGAGTVASDVSWDINCNTLDLKKRDSIDLRFIVVDNANKCRIYKADTVNVIVHVLKPLNQAPQLVVTNDNTANTLLSNNNISMVRGPEVKLLLSGTDADLLPKKDNLTLQLVGTTGTVEPKGYTFETVQGTSPVQTVFSWQPDCSVFENGVYENDYVFTFRLGDDRCLTGTADTVKITLKVKDIESNESAFIPPNFFSPNGDNVNDYYAMEALDPETHELVSILPIDNCDSHFEGVSIVNRWGKEVFSSTDRDFKWYGLNESPGVYFYSIKFSKKEYHGAVTLRN